MRNYIIIEKDDLGDLFLSEGKGTTSHPYDESEYWHQWEHIGDLDSMFERIKQLFNRTG